MFEHFTPARPSHSGGQRSKGRKENLVAYAAPLQTPREIFMRKHVSNL